MELHDGGLEDVPAEEAVVVEEVRAAPGPAVLAPVAALAVDERQGQLVHVVVSGEGEAVI